MDRIASLINKLKLQYEQQTDPSVMLGTIQLLEFELSKMNSAVRQSLGTSKVAVILPIATKVAQAAGAENETYTSRPVEHPPATKEVKETLLVEEGSVSLVQKNGQLDMVFESVTDIPTLSHQASQAIDGPPGEESINDKLKQGKTELVERLKETPVKDLRKAIGINDRYQFIHELFRGDEAMYERCIKTINSFSIYPEAEYWIARELKVKLGWSDENPTVQYFDQLVKRRFS